MKVLKLVIFTLNKMLQMADLPALWVVFSQL